MASSSTTQTASEFELFSAALNDFLRATRRARGRLAAQEGDEELSLSQYHLLDPLERCGTPLTLGELAEAAGVAPPTATRMLDGLERDALVLRERAEGDRRRVDVRITALGRERVEAKREQIAAGRAKVFASLSVTQRREAARVLASLADAMDHLR